MSAAKDVSTPLSTSQSLRLVHGTAPVDNSDFRRIIGSLQYLSLTCPDISFTANKLSQFMHKPTETHWTATKRLLRYLKQTIFHGIQISKSGLPLLTTFSDADWVGNVNDRTSTFAVARSSTEAEYRALAKAASKTMWLQNLLKELGFPLKTAPQLLCDNIHISASIQSIIPV